MGQRPLRESLALVSKGSYWMTTVEKVSKWGFVQVVVFFFGFMVHVGGGCALAVTPPHCTEFRRSLVRKPPAFTGCPAEP